MPLYEYQCKKLSRCAGVSEVLPSGSPQAKS